MKELITRWPVALAGVLTALGLIGGRIMRAARLLVRVDHLLSMDAKLTTIVEQFAPNGGSTLRDRVDSALEKLGDVDRRLAEVEAVTSKRTNTTRTRSTD